MYTQTQLFIIIMVLYHGTVEFSNLIGQEAVDSFSITTHV